MGKRFIVDHHDTSPELYEAKFGRRGLFRRLMVLLEWLTVKAADVVISTNESHRRVAIERGGKLAEDVFGVRSGADRQGVKTVPHDPSLRNGRTFLVGYVGVMAKHKGIDMLLASVRHLVTNQGRQDIQFALVGGGPELKPLQALFAEMDLADYVTFTGRAPDEVLFGVLSTTDECVNADRVNPMNGQSTMNKIMEYMAFGKPIVQFDVTEGRLSAGEASLYAAPNDPKDFADNIEVLAADAPRRAQMGDFDRRRVERELAWEYEVPKSIGAHERAAVGRPTR